MNEKCIELGKTGLKVVKLGLGAAPFGSEYGNVSADQCSATLNRALQEGITYIDTAPWYGDGTFFYKAVPVLKITGY